MNLPDGFISENVQCNGINLHVVHNGGDSPLTDRRTPILFLHGFPEFWIAWQSVFEKLSDDYLIIAPDQRGYNLSDAPEGEDNYKAKLLVGDILELTQQLLGERSFVLAGHDWGASIAYALAITAPDRISKLIIANGVHPVSFQEAIIDVPEQAAASQYFHVLRAENASVLMAEDNYRRTLAMFEKFSATPWLTDEDRDAYREAWGRPGRLEAMLHWYNSSPIIIPKPSKTGIDAPLYGVDRSKFRLPMPHLLFWGMKDQALLPASKKAVAEFCDDFHEVEIVDAEHWLLHTHSDLIARKMREFIG
ncbi:MAG: alpha/beta hydrolase [Rhizobiaceae bacterium]|nr:alpha/beta hydrolase [Rhizobiaceae bacterium]